jgi:hypothetical protein
MEKKKNPLIAGLLNILIPGLGHLYLGHWPGCILWFFGYAVIGGIVFFIASFVERSFGDHLQGLPTIILILLFVLMLFNDAFTFAKRQNKKAALAMPETKKSEEQEDTQAKLKKFQEMFNAGLITKEDYERKKADILSRM